MNDENFDLIIVGGGPMGIALGIEARKANLNYLILEKGTLVNSIFHFPKNMTFFSTSQRLEIGEVPFISHLEKPTRTEALEYYRRVVDQWNLNLKNYETVLNIQKIDKNFEVRTDKNQYKSKKIVVATGFYDQPNLLNIPGENLSKVSHYFDEAHPYVGQKVAVIGAANSAAQVALELFYKGAVVTMIIREKGVGENVKYWIKPNLENRIDEGSIKVFYNSIVVEIKSNSILIEQNGEQKELENDFVLAMTGYHPNYDFLKKIGINCETNDAETPFYSEENNETNIPGLYLAGVVCGGKHTSKFIIENSKIHAENIIQDIVKQQSKEN